MSEIGQGVDDRAGGVRGQIDGRLMGEGADHEHVGELVQVAGEIGDGFAFAEAGVGPEEDRLPPRWAMPASKLTRVRSEGFSKSRTITRLASNGSRNPFSYFCLRSTATEKIRSISAAVRSARVSKCRIRAPGEESQMMNAE